MKNGIEGLMLKNGFTPKSSLLEIAIPNNGVDLSKGFFIIMGK
ncbi:hypothetical protein BN1805_01367 [Proteus vulgaris]|nr:hypothetical protein BN1805_01367 [Proteus vulgaris]